MLTVVEAKAHAEAGGKTKLVAPELDLATIANLPPERPSPGLAKPRSQKDSWRGAWRRRKAPDGARTSSAATAARPAPTLGLISGLAPHN
jgi:hypothetical protein